MKYFQRRGQYLIFELEKQRLFHDNLLVQIIHKVFPILIFFVYSDYYRGENSLLINNFMLILDYYLTNLSTAIIMFIMNSFCLFTIFFSNLFKATYFLESFRYYLFIYYQLFYKMFHYVECYIIGLTLAEGNKIGNYSLLILACANLLLTIIMVLLYQIFMIPILSLSTKCYIKLRLTLKDHLAQYLIVQNMFLMGFFNNQLIYQVEIIYALIISMFLISLITFKSIYFSYKYFEPKQIQLFIFIELISLFIQYRSIQQQYMKLNRLQSFYLLLFPILLHILLTIYKRQTIQLFLTKPNQLLKNQISAYLHLQYCGKRLFSNNSEQYKLLCYIMMFDHKKNCNDLSCQCQQALNNLLNFDIFYQSYISFYKIHDQINEGLLFWNLSNCCHYIWALSLSKQYLQAETFSQRVSKKFDFNFISKIRWQSFLYLYHSTQNSDILSNIDTYSSKYASRVTHNLSYNLNLQIKHFVQIDQQENKIQSIVLKLINLKIELLKQTNLLHSSNYYNLYSKNVQLILKEKEKIKKIITKSKCNTKYLIILDNHFNLYSILIEGLFNNWEKAQIYYYAYMNQDQIQKFQDIYIPENQHYMKFQYNLLDLSILSYSKKVPRLFGYTNSEFKQINLIDSLLPPKFNDIHQKLLIQFINTGKCKYFRNTDVIMAQSKFGEGLTFDLTFNIYSTFDHLQIIGLIETKEEQQCIAMLNNENKIILMNQQFKNEFEILQQKDFRQINMQTLELTFEDNKMYLKYSQLNKTFVQGDCQVSNKNQKILIDGTLFKKNEYSILYVYKFEQNSYFSSRLFLSLKKQSLFSEEEIVKTPYIDDPQNQIFSDSGQQQLKVNLLFNSLTQEQQKSQQSNQQSQQSQNEGLFLEPRFTETHNSSNELSKYSKKYKMFFSLTKKKKQSSHVKQIIYLILLLLVIQTTYLVIIFVQSTNNQVLTNYYYKFIQINYHIVEPMQKFMLSKYTSSYYYSLKKSGELTDEEQKLYKDFSDNNLVKSYLIFKENYQTYFADKTLQSIIFHQDIEISQQIIYNKPYEYDDSEMSLYSSFQILLYSYYSAYKIYLNGGYLKQSDPLTSYQLLNLDEFIGVFNDLSVSFVELALSGTKQIVQGYQILLIVFNLIGLLIFMLLYYHQYQQINEIQELLNLHSIISPEIRQTEIDKYNGLFTRLKDQFDTSNEISLKMHHSETSNSNNNIIQKRLSQQVSIPYIRIYWFFWVIFLQYLLFCLGIDIGIIAYYNEIPNYLNELKQVSDLSVDLPAMFAYVQILFEYNPDIMSDEDYQNLSQWTEESVDRVMEYINDFEAPTQFSDSYQEFYYQLHENSVCDVLNPTNYVNFTLYCNDQNSILRSGLLISLTTLAADIKTIIESDFQEQQLKPYELESAYLCSDAINLLLQKLDKEIYQLNDDNEFTVQLIIIFAILLVFVLFTIVCCFTQPQLHLTYYISRLSFYAIPSDLLFQNDYIEREIKRILIIRNLQ